MSRERSATPAPAPHWPEHSAVFFGGLLAVALGALAWMFLGI